MMRLKETIKKNCRKKGLLNLRRWIFVRRFPCYLFLIIIGGSFGMASQLQGAERGGTMQTLSLESAAPDFHLPDVVTGEIVSRDDFKDKKALLIMILCRHCPYVQHIKKELSQFGRDYAGKDIAMVAISANDPEGYPEDHPDQLKAMAEEEGFVFPFLFDETQEAAKAFSAVATPDFFLFDEERKLVYRGQFDDSRPRGGIPVTGRDLRGAVDAVLEEKPVPGAQKPAVGCSIKWKPGNNPTLEKFKT